jgi:hypothetical protein
VPDSRLTTLHLTGPPIPNAPITLHAMGKTYEMQAHSTDSLREHRRSNVALGMIPESNISLLTHFVEVELPSDVVTFFYATVPGGPHALMGNMLVTAIHVPPESRRIAAERRMRRTGLLQANAPGLTHTLRRLGVKPAMLASANVGHADLLQASAQILDPGETAKSILFQHPEIASLNPEIAADMLDFYIEQSLDLYPQLWQYISSHGPGSREPWQTVTHSTHGDGSPFEPPDDVLDRDGKPLEWPMDAAGKRRIPRSELSDGVLAAARPGLDYILRETKNDANLHGVVWTRNHGIPVTHDKQQSQAPPRAAGPGVPTAAAYKWTLTNPGSGYGLDIDDSIGFNPANAEATVKLKNTANRCLGAYVQFFDSEKKAVALPDWTERTKVGRVSDPTVKYIAFVRPVSTVFGIPMPADTISLSFPFPDSAVKAKVYLGGLGQGARNPEIANFGLISTCVLNYGIPSLMICFGVGLDSTAWYFSLLTNPTVLELLLGVAMLEVGDTWRTSMSTEFFLKKAASVIGTIIFTKVLIIPVTKYIVARVVGQQVMQNMPIAGWVYRVMSLTAAAGNLISTTVAVAQAPTIYTLEVDRSIEVKVTVRPDPAHGGADAVWPENFDHYDLILTHSTGATEKKTALPKPAGRNTPIQDTFTGVPAGAGDKIQVTANLYASNETLRGSWTSEWIAAVGADGSSTVSIGGNIIERLVPLSSDTSYAHKRKLAFDTSAKKHVWQETAAAPQTVWSQTGSGDPDHNVSRLVNLTINNHAYRIGYTWMASGQNLPLDLGSERTNNQAFAFQSVNTGQDPEKGIKEPSRAFSVQPFLTYDQFGPVPLLTAPLSLQPALDQAGDAVPPELRQLFVDAGKDAPQSRKVVAPTVEWWLYIAGQPKYVLRRQPAQIAVYPYPNPEYSPRNFFLDPRAVADRQHLRHVDLGDNASRTFDYATGKSWGAFTQSNLDAVVVHPRGYVIGVSYRNHKMEVLALPETARADAEAPVAIPASGRGVQEGLMNAPKAMTVAADGRVLVLEQGNARVQAFDIHGNPTQCFAGALTFEVDGAHAAGLDQRQVTPQLAEALQKGVPPTIAPRAYLQQSARSELDAGRISTSVRQAISNRGITLSDKVQLKTVTAGKIWLLQDVGESISYDLRDDGAEVPLRAAASYGVEIEGKGSQWIVRDATNVQTFRIRRKADGKLAVRQLVATMALKDAATANVEYLDIATEPEGFIYVLSYARPGNKAADYRLDIYNPDGSHLARTPNKTGDSNVACAKIVVDHWRTLYALNYESFRGPGGRTEPSVSQWAPSVPKP